MRRVPKEGSTPTHVRGCRDDSCDARACRARGRTASMEATRETFLFLRDPCSSERCRARPRRSSLQGPPTPCPTCTSTHHQESCTQVDEGRSLFSLDTVVLQSTSRQSARFVRKATFYFTRYQVDADPGRTECEGPGSVESFFSRGMNVRRSDM